MSPRGAGGGGNDAGDRSADETEFPALQVARGSVAKQQKCLWDRCQLTPSYAVG